MVEDDWLRHSRIFPVVGEAKYLDEVAMGGKVLLMNGDELLEGGRRIEKAADAIGDLSRLGRTKADDIIDSLKAMIAKAGKKINKLDDVKTAENAAENVLEAGAKNLDEAAEAAAEATKRVDDVVEGGLEPGTLSNVDARKWYLEQEAKIPDLIDDNLPLEQQARQAFDLRNQYRTQARELMSDRQLAESLYATDPNLTWEQVIQKQIDKGLSGDDIYKAIIESSQRSRTSVNQSLGLE